MSWQGVCPEMHVSLEGSGFRADYVVHTPYTMQCTLNSSDDSKTALKSYSDRVGHGMPLTSGVP